MQALKGLVALALTVAAVFTVTMMINHHTERAYVLKSMQQTAAATDTPRLAHHKAAPSKL